MGKLFLLCFDFPFFILIPSGRILNADFIRSLMVTTFLPSTLAFRASRRTRLSIFISLSSAESSIVMTLSPPGMYEDSALRNVVLPDPVPPLMKMLYLAFTSDARNPAASSDTEPISIIFSIDSGVL